MKYTLSLLLVGVLVFTGASCSKGDDAAADATIPSLSTTNTESVNTADNINTTETATNAAPSVNTATNTTKTSGVTTTNANAAGLEEPAPAASSYSATDIAKHATAADCWSAIDGKVYNISSYINQHPGGRVVTQACGKDGSQLFKTQGGEGQHSSTARVQLAKFEIGTLK